MAGWSTASTTAIAVGEVQTVSNSALLTPFDTQAVAIGREQGSAELVVYNFSSVALTVFAADQDLDASYQAFKVDGTAVTITATTAQQFRCSARFIRLRCASDPGTGVISIGR